MTDLSFPYCLRYRRGIRVAIASRKCRWRRSAQRACRLDDVAAVQDDDLVHGFKPRQPMSDHHRCLAPGELDQVRRQRIGGRDIQVLPGLVEDQDREASEDDASIPTRCR